MLKVSERWLADAEKQYPGIRETVAYYEAQTVPDCGYCGSSDTAKVSAGLVGRSVTVAAATTRIHLRPNGPNPAPLYCNACGRYFRADEPTPDG